MGGFRGTSWGGRQIIASIKDIEYSVTSDSGRISEKTTSEQRTDSFHFP